MNATVPTTSFNSSTVSWNLSDNLVQDIIGDIFKNINQDYGIDYTSDDYYSSRENDLTNAINTEVKDKLEYEFQAMSTNILKIESKLNLTLRQLSEFRTAIDQQMSSRAHQICFWSTGALGLTLLIILLYLCKNKIHSSRSKQFQYNGGTVINSQNESLSDSKFIFEKV